MQPMFLSEPAATRMGLLAIRSRMCSPSAKKWMGNYAIPEVRDLTNKIDRILAKHYGYEEALGHLDLAYYTAYKPTGERPGTKRPGTKRPRASRWRRHAGRRRGESVDDDHRDCRWTNLGSKEVRQHSTNDFMR